MLVSDLSEKDVARFWRYIDKSGDCWLWRGTTRPSNRPKSKQYGEMKFGRHCIIRAHRLSWEYHNGPIPEGLCVLHKCDNPPCVRPDHLFVGTQADNLADMVKKGRARHGNTPKKGNGSCK